MRELKFRIWCGEHTDENPYDDDYGYEYYDLSNKVKECFSGWVELRLPNKVDAIEQYTGLKDKNGKEIYEGDIVQESNGKTVVEFSTEGIGSCGCCVDKFWGSGFIVTINDSPEDCEVIGNIHENKELLEGK